MSIVYSSISRGDDILVECYAPEETSRGTPEYAVMVKQLLAKIDYTSSIQKSYFHNAHSFNFVTANGLCFLSVADKSFQTRICFAFLNRVQSEYKPGGRYKAKLAENIHYFSHNAGADKIRSIQSEVDQVKEVMQNNIKDILERGDKLDKLVEDTERLEMGSKMFKEGATELKRAMCMRNVKLTVAIIVIVLVVIFFIIVGVCGGFTFAKCKSA